jgi:hypothetical protein
MCTGGAVVGFAAFCTRGLPVGLAVCNLWVGVGGSGWVTNGNGLAGVIAANYDGCGMGTGFEESAG